MPMAVTLATWTLADYHQMVVSGLLDRRRVELGSGNIVEMAPESAFHSDRVDVAANYLRRLLGNRALIREGRPVTIPGASEPEPDIAVVKPQRYRNGHPGPTDIFWLVEISNTTLEFDLGAKARAYAAGSVAEYWVIDAINQRLIVHRQPESESYRYQTNLTSGYVSTPAFPTIEISIEQLLS
ncbi:MAG: Uma2 family endonuclease [Cyanobacteria bacterium P01_E01_bin.48]